MPNSRVYKHWWLMQCERCGREFVSCKKHAETCDVACRVQLHRGKMRRFKCVPIPLGWHREKPTRDQWAELAHFQKKIQGIVYQDEGAAQAAQAAELPAELPAAELPAICAPMAAQEEDQERIIEALLWGSDAQEFLGIADLPMDRPQYEKARKRVHNLLNAAHRSTDDKERIAVCWRWVQTHAPYQPRVRSGSETKSQT